MMSVFKRGGTSLERIMGHIAEMVADARHSFGAATDAVLSQVVLAVAAEDIFGVNSSSTSAFEAPPISAPCSDGRCWSRRSNASAIRPRTFWTWLSRA